MLVLSRLAFVFVLSGLALVLVLAPVLVLALVFGLPPGYTSAKAKTGARKRLIGWVRRVGLSGWVG